MLVEHYRKEFMELIAATRVIIISNQDVDGVCTVKILTNLFKTEGIPYVLLSCDGISSMKAKYDEYSSQSDWFILVNCGASVDLLDTLEHPSSTKKFFVIDSHRPIHIINYFDTTGQVRLISVPEPEEKIPDFDEVFAQADVSDDDEDEDDEQNEDLDDDARAEKARKRREHQLWLKKRERILFNYREYNYYARPSALYALEVAWVMSRDDMEWIWCSIVSLTDALISGRLSRAKYTEYASSINDHIVRIRSGEKLPRDCLKISFERELQLFLYRNWSLYESCKMTPYLVNSLRTWSFDGNRKFHQMLAHLGLPLAEAKQKHLNMSVDLRRQLIEMFTSETVTEKFQLPDAVFGSFIAEIGYRAKFNAMDSHLAILALLEEPSKENKSAEEKFMEAMKVLNVRENETSFKNGVEKAKIMLKLMWSHVQMMVDTKAMQEVGPFIILQMSETLMDFNYFRRPSSIPFLTQCLQHAGIRSSGKKRWRQCPWIIMIPHSPEYFLAVGVQPGSYEQEGEKKNIFGEVFRVLQKKMEGDNDNNIILDFFEGWTILVKTEKRQYFIDQLLAISE